MSGTTIISQSENIANITQAISGQTTAIGQDVTLTVAANYITAVYNVGAGVEIEAAAGASIIDNGGYDNAVNGYTSLAGGGTFSVGSSDSLLAINNSSYGTIVAGQGEQIIDAGGIDNATFGQISLAGGGTFTLSSHDLFNAIDNSTHGTIIAGQGEQIIEAGGLNNSTFGTISLAGNGELSVSSTDFLNAIDNSTDGTITAGQGEKIIDVGGLNNSTYGVLNLNGATASVSQEIDNDAQAVINIDNGSTLTAGTIFGGTGTIAFGGSGNAFNVGASNIALNLGNLGTITGFNAGDSINLTGTTYQQGADSLSSYGPGLFYGHEGVFANGTLISQFVSISGDTFSLSSGMNGDIQLNGGPVIASHNNQTISQSQTVAMINDNTVGDTITVNNGSTLSVTNTGTNAIVNGSDVINIGSNSAIQDAGGINNSGTGIVNIGTNGTLSVASTDPNAINNANNGTINATQGGVLSDAGGLNNTNGGIVNLGGGTNATINGTINDTQNGTISLSGSGTLTAGSAINGAGGTISLSGINNVLNVASGSNLGTLTGFAGNDQLNISGTQFNAGDSLVSNGNVVTVMNGNNTLATFDTIAGEAFSLSSGPNGQVEVSSSVLSHNNQTISQSQSNGLISDNTVGDTITVNNGSTLAVTNPGTNAIINGSDTINIGNNSAVQDAGGINNSGTGIVNIGTNGTLGVASTDPNAINNANYGTIAVSQNGVISDAGGLNNSNDGLITLASNGTLSVNGTGPNAINNTNNGTITATQGGVLSDAGGLNNTNDGIVNLGGGTNATIDGVIDNDQHGTINLSGSGTLTAESAINGGNGTINLTGTSNVLNIATGSNLGTLSGFTGNDLINIIGAKINPYDSLVTNGSIVTVMDGNATLASFGTLAGETFNIAGGPNGSLEIICFLAGTDIATPEGAVEVQTLRAGDMVVTASGEAKPVRWVGRSTISTRFADPVRSAPIRITAGALGDNLPVRDLLVSPAHAMFVGGILVQAGAMVNGTSIRREVMSEESFSYYHVELENHELIVAEGAACESFIDNVDRMNFDNWAEHETAELSEPMAEVAYPRAKSARQVPQSVKAYLAQRAALVAPTANVA